MPRVIDPDISDIMFKGMLEDIRERVAEDLENKLVEDFRIKAKELVREATAGLTFKAVERMRSALHMREELYVQVDMGGENVVTKTVR